MKHPERIQDYLQHIIEAIDHIISYFQELDGAAALERDHKTQAAVIRNIEIIGRGREQNPQPGAGVGCRQLFPAVA